MKENFSDYELHVIKDIATHIVEPNALQQTLKILGKPIEKVFELADRSRIKILKKTSTIVKGAIQDAILSTITLSSKSRLFSEKNVIREYHKRDVFFKRLEEAREKNIPLELMDNVADSYDISNAVILGLEGFIFGGITTVAEAVPFAQVLVPVIITADVSASMTFLSRHVSLVAGSYGYSANDPYNITHILAAMAPLKESFDEGYFGTKATIIGSIHEVGAFVSKYSGRITPELLEKEAPYLLRLIVLVADRLGVILTEKVLAMIVFLAGAALNSTINIAFQQVGHTASRDYFRKLTLERKYGEDEVRAAIEKEVQVLKKQK